MNDVRTKPTPGKGKAFFDQGDQVAETGNWDYAIEMYREGIIREPDNLERGYHKLRIMALNRKAKGGKSASFSDKRKAKMGKDPAENVANAAFLWAKDPGSMTLMEQLLKMAWKAELSEVVLWIGEIMIEAQRNEKRPSKRLCVTITDALEAFKHYPQAIIACDLARKAAPNDNELESRISQLSTDNTIKQGQYDNQDVDFINKVKDMDKQKEFLQKDMLVKGEDMLKQEITRAKTEYEASPTVPGKINGLVDALLKFEDEAYENEAIDVLAKAFNDTKAYQFKMRIGDIKIKQLSRRFRKYRAAGDATGATQVAREQLQFEVQEYRERVANYPTDLGMKFELGRRLFLTGEYDDAIGVLQQAQRDPRRFVTTMNYLGLAFMKKQWWQEAIDTFQKVLDSEISEDKVKEIRFNLAEANEMQGDQNQDVERWKQAEDHYSHVAQIDFNYKDTRSRLEAVRKKMQDARGSGA